MNPLICTASPLEIAALWRLSFLSGDDVAAVCMRWLEQDLDRGDADIAAFAGQSDLVREEIAPVFERTLNSVTGRCMARDEAILRALRLHLASAVNGEGLMKGVQLIIDRFRSISERRLVRNLPRAEDRPDEVFAEQNLGLEYVYGCFYAFDDIWHLSGEEQIVAEIRLLADLRESVQELRDHLTAMLAE